ncbi:uncharacterized protein LOC131356320 [Hemibagrus wyckioides]|uniref:uncharacterized protein LOC131356320 n=1 Tax=Hemibagrus wyckioides TaxID=337641 RepID=UPI00266B68DE|nr:uncharacterized protein LOC131356320 [Hemibagrus wyckioides]
MIFSSSLENHTRHVRLILSRLLQLHLYVKLEKSEFHCTTITFLGYVLSPGKVEMDQAILQAVSAWPEPATVKDLQHFLGFANFYRHFIRNYSVIAGPLTSLLKGKPKRLSWTDRACDAFQKLKNSFTTAPILRDPDLDNPFVGLWKLMPPALGLGRSCRNASQTPGNSTHVHTSPGS